MCAAILYTSLLPARTPTNPLSWLQNSSFTVLTVLTASSTWASLWRFCSTRSWFTS